MTMVVIVIVAVAVLAIASYENYCICFGEVWSDTHNCAHYRDARRMAAAESKN